MKQVWRARVLQKKFFERAAATVARELLGKFLVLRRRTSLAFMITETEAYIGPKDRASHAHRGHTARNAPMFGEAGRWYVYFTYGMHWMLNIVTGPKNYPAAVLIRSIEGINGPARVTKKLKIDKKFNNQSADWRTGLWVENRGVKIKKSQIKHTPRIGVDYAGKWAKKPYRFFINGML